MNKIEKIWLDWSMNMNEEQNNNEQPRKHRILQGTLSMQRKFYDPLTKKRVNMWCSVDSSGNLGKWMYHESGY